MSFERGYYWKWCALRLLLKRNKNTLLTILISDSTIQYIMTVYGGIHFKKLIYVKVDF